MKSLIESALNRIEEVALIKGIENYKWYRYNGPVHGLERHGVEDQLKKGEIFGVRPSSNGKKIRVILKSLGPTKVFTVEPDELNWIAKKSKPVTKVSDMADENEDNDFDNMSDSEFAETYIKKIPFKGILEKGLKYGANMAGVKYWRKIAAVIEDLEEAKDQKSWNKQFNKVAAAVNEKPVKVPVKATKNDKLLKYAQATIKSATRQFNDAKKWDAFDMIALKINDAADHLEIACYLYQGDESKAANLQYNLDTGSAEELPNAVWYYLDR